MMYSWIIKRYCFAGLYLVHSILLHNHHITSVESHAFCDLFDLKILDLSNNVLTHLYGNIIKGTSFFKLFILKNIPTKYLDKNLWHGNNFIVIHTNDYGLCCVAVSFSVCTATLPWYIFCDNLLLNFIMRWSFKTLSILIIIVNGISFVIHFLEKGNKGYFACVVAVNISDILCGVYLGIIWIADVVFNG